MLKPNGRLSLRRCCCRRRRRCATWAPSEETCCNGHAAAIFVTLVSPAINASRGPGAQRCTAKIGSLGSSAAVQLGNVQFAALVDGQAIEFGGPRSGEVARVSLSPWAQGQPTEFVWKRMGSYHETRSDQYGCVTKTPTATTTAAKQGEHHADPGPSTLSLL